LDLSLNENVRRKVFWSPHSCSLIQVGGHTPVSTEDKNRKYIVVSSLHLQALLYDHIKTLFHT
jgi:hypothetical protein